MYGRASPMTESAIVTTSATSPAGAGGDRMQHPCEGRVGKAARRRSRASRKAPTTVLNTDTTNFRAMVQQFTGGPSGAPFQAAYPLMGDGVTSPATLSFGLSAGAAAQQPAVFPALGVQQLQQQYQQYPHFQQHHERPLFTPGGTGSDDVYLPRFASSNPQMDITDSPDSFLLERISSTQVMPRPAAPTGSSTTTDGFLPW